MSREGLLWVPSVPNEMRVRYPSRQKRSSSRDVGTSSYRYHTAAILLTTTVSSAVFIPSRRVIKQFSCPVPLSA
ncbi:hypothetical protein TNCV_4914231 [Trichonephila clavipes]|nr:hypothetical protein TNCV_4914231 [Trichonephila clavipes]